MNSARIEATLSKSKLLTRTFGLLLVSCVVTAAAARAAQQPEPAGVFASTEHQDLAIALGMDKEALQHVREATARDKDAKPTEATVTAYTVFMDTKEKNAAINGYIDKMPYSASAIESVNPASNERQWEITFRTPRLELA